MDNYSEDDRHFREQWGGWFGLVNERPSRYFCFAPFKWWILQSGLHLR